MKEQEVQQFAFNLAKKYNEDSVDITETSMSWIVITKAQVFKIKKPIKDQWVDYSELSNRKYYCEAEVELNRLLAPNVYLGVIPILHSLLPANGHQSNSIVDYAVLMKKLRLAKQMNRMLDRKEVTKEHILKLVRYLVRFHSHSEVVDVMPINTHFQDCWHKVVQFDYVEDIPVLSNIVSISNAFKRADELFKSFFDNHNSYLNDRKDFGKVRMLHGNLQCDNVYLYNKPLILDCVEFSERLKQVDVLNEAARLCMDLDAHDELYLSDYFYKQYKKRMGVVNEECDDYLFMLYKVYHALEKANKNKVKAISATNRTFNNSYVNEINLYFNLIKTYVDWLDRAST